MFDRPSSGVSSQDVEVRPLMMRRAQPMLIKQWQRAMLTRGRALRRPPPMLRVRAAKRLDVKLITAHTVTQT